MAPKNKIALGPELNGNHFADDTSNLFLKGSNWLQVSLGNSLMPDRLLVIR